MEFGFEDLVAQVERAGGDVSEQLRRAAERSRDLSGMADSLLDHFVQKARDEGLTWAQIGEVLNVSKQAAQQRGVRVMAGLSQAAARRLLRMVPSKGLFYRFTAKARTAIAAAQRAAGELGHGSVGTEHLLIGLLETEGVASEALANLGLDAAGVRARLASAPGTSDATSGGRFTPNAKKVLELSLREALKMGHNYIGTEHLAVAMIEHGHGAGYQTLSAAGVEAEPLKHQVRAILARRASGGGSA